MDNEKSVDESWKESAAEDKERLNNINQPEDKQPSEAANQQPAEEKAQEKQSDAEAKVEVNFLNYVASLGFQAMIFMGEIPNPMTNEKDQNLDQARFLVDTLVMMREKTKGNLDENESRLLENTIYELQMKYVEITKTGE